MSDYSEDFSENNDLGWDETNELPSGFYQTLPVPLYWRVLILPVQPRTTTKSGIVIPQATTDKQKYLNYLGKIVAIGDLAWTHEKYKQCKRPAVGDYVVYGRYAGQPFRHKGVRMLALNDDELLTLVPDPQTLKVDI